MGYIIGVLMILAGLGLGAYVGIWLCFVGGIIDIINGFQINPIDAMKIATGGVKALILPEIAGGLCAFILIFPGLAMMGLQSMSGFNKRFKNKRR